MRALKSIFVTGGAGFIGSAFIRYLLQHSDFIGRVVNLDRLTYAANLELLQDVESHPRYRFVQGDINDQTLVESLIEEEKIDTMVHFAAETHVDRSIASARPFVEANVLGTLTLLEAVRKFPEIHFHHVSTDEVYGMLGESGAFNESSPYRPNSPYAASKAASDHLVRAFAHTYKLSTTISHCSNNYGPGQFPEKIIPLMIHRALAGQPLPIYGRGANIRDWLYVDDHARAIFLILRKGKSNQTYDIGGNCELSNLQLVNILLETLAQETGKNLNDLLSLISFVTDRPGHDFRYAIDSSKIQHELGWQPRMQIRSGLIETVRWYAHSIVGRYKP
jgi:dTDP-glucose 4,6-dehydratase